MIRERNVLIMKEIKLDVEGMSCTGCENRIQNTLKEIEGVESVMADYVKKEVSVILKDDIEQSILKEAIEDLGFEVVE